MANQYDAHEIQRLVRKYLIMEVDDGKFLKRTGFDIIGDLPSVEGGTPGPPGPQGEQGIPGEQGIQGVPGTQGIDGAPGAKGDKGDPGDQGVQGLQGIQGIPGDAGAQGIQGIPGAKGDTGDTGPQGQQGIQGLPGADGAQGAQGEQGIQGIQGLQGIPGGDITLADIYPIGSVYLSVVATNPNTLFGFGTWAAIGAGRVLVGYDAGDADFNAAEKTGGAKTVASSAQSFAGTPSTVVVNHVHVQSLPTGQTGSQASGTRDASTTGSQADALSTANPTGGAANYTPAGTNTPGAATSVVQPYLVVYMWKRTA